MKIFTLIKRLFFLLLISFFLYQAAVNWRSAFLGWALIVLYFVFIGRLAKRVLTKWFSFSNSLRVSVLSWFLLFILLNTFSGLSILWGGFSAYSIIFGFALTGSFFIFLDLYFTSKQVEADNEEKNAVLEVWEEPPSAKVALLIYLALSGVAFYILWHSRQGGVAASPWQVISPHFAFYFLFATAILGILIFTKIKTKVLLFLICAHTFLLHAYLPLTHPLFYGADQWRHVASEKALAENGAVPVAKLSTENNNDVFDAARLSYIQFWSAGIIFNKIGQVDLISFNRWYLPILWSLLLPILLYELGRTIGYKKKESVFLAWLGLLPYAFQAGGALSLPVNFGFLVWLLFLLLFFRRKKNSAGLYSRPASIASLCLGALLVFSYSLYFILFWLMAALYYSIKIFSKWGAKLRVIAGVCGMVALALILPAAEIIFGYSKIPTSINFLGSIKQLLGNFSAWYITAGPRPHDILTGNVLFNQTPSYAFTANFLTAHRWWLFPFALLFISMCLYSLISEEKKQENFILILIGRFFAAVGAGYFVSRYLLTGENILTRRLDAVLALGLIILFLNSLVIIGSKPKLLEKIKSPRLIIAFAVILIACAITASYSLGPDTKTVSLAQYNSMQYIWSQEKNEPTHCVVADTYPLLALEAISGKKIIGGGFPIDQYYFQPELNKFLAAAGKKENWVEEAKKLNNASRCWYISDDGTIYSNDTTQSNNDHVKINKI